jgi:predicted metal-dependent hydrolase
MNTPETMEARIIRYEIALKKIQRGDYDNAHDCKAASKVAAEALSKPPSNPNMAPVFWKFPIQ